MFTQRRRFSWTQIILLLAMSSFTLDTVNAGDNATGTRYGMRIELDDTSTCKQYCVAVLEGNVEAAYHLGWMRFSGQGVPVDQCPDGRLVSDGREVR